MVEPSHKYTVKERAIMPVASVVMKGGIFSFVIIKPFARPNPMPTPTHASIEIIRGKLPDPCMNINTVPAVDRTDPLERSIPPEIITNVIPSEMMPTDEAFLNMVVMLFQVVNLPPVRTPTTNVIPRKIKIIPKRDHSSPKVHFPSLAGNAFCGIVFMIPPLTDYDVTIASAA
jgi:hypothetical protein